MTKITLDIDINEPRGSVGVLAVNPSTLIGMIVKLSKENREQLEPLLKFPTIISPQTGDTISAPPTLEEVPQIILQFIKLIGAHIDEGGFFPAPNDIVGLQILFETLTARIRLVRSKHGDNPYESNWKL